VRATDRPVATTLAAMSWTVTTPNSSPGWRRSITSELTPRRRISAMAFSTLASPFTMCISRRITSETWIV